MSVGSLAAAGLIAAAIAGSSITPLGAATAAPSAPRHCFFITEWQGWKSPSPNVLYLGVRLHDVYRVELSGGSYSLQSPEMHLVSIHRRSSSICDALDLDLRLSDGHGFSEPLIARSMTKLTPEEVAAIPAKYRP